MSIPKTKSRNDFPGDTAVVFTSAATDESGTNWPRGTVMQPLAGGYDNRISAKYQQFNGARFVDLPDPACE